MNHRARKGVYLFFTMLCGIYTFVFTVVTINGEEGLVAPLAIFGVLFLLFLSLHIYHKQKDKKYYCPYKMKTLNVNSTDVLASEIVETASKCFPKILKRGSFNFERKEFDDLHFQCRKRKLSELTIQLVAKDIWEHMGSDSSCPDVYIKKTNDSNFAGFATTDLNARTILLTFQKGFTDNTVISILVHELAHFYQLDHNYIPNGVFDEMLTDCFSAFIGFGPQFIYGRYTSYSESMGTYNVIHSNKIGYISDVTFSKIYSILNNGSVGKSNSEDVAESDSQAIDILYHRYSNLRNTTIMMARSMQKIGNMSGNGLACSLYVELIENNSPIVIDEKYQKYLKTKDKKIEHELLKFLGVEKELFYLMNQTAAKKEKIKA